MILLEINPTNSQIVKSYVYAQDDLVTQYDGDQETGDRYFYVCDRLGNVRQVIDVNASVQYLYAYGPFGKVLESDEDADPPGNAFRFTGNSTTPNWTSITSAPANIPQIYPASPPATPTPANSPNPPPSTSTSTASTIPSTAATSQAKSLYRK